MLNLNRVLNLHKISENSPKIGIKGKYVAICCRLKYTASTSSAGTLSNQPPLRGDRSTLPA